MNRILRTLASTFTRTLAIASIFALPGCDLGTYNARSQENPAAAADDEKASHEEVENENEN